jgi:glycosyltransferase involved in cell wall biosynthesis
MHILIVCPVFPPEPVVSSQTTAQIAEGLVQCGHVVTVITAFPTRPAGRLYQGYSRKLFERQSMRNGIEIIRCFSFLSSDSSMSSRFLENISFGLTGGWATLVSRRPDVIYANTWPIFATAILSLVARIRGIPLVVNIQDVYPESLVSQKRIKSDGMLTRLMRWVDGLIARGSQGIIVISGSFAKIYRDNRGVSSDRLHIIPNWLDSQAVVPSASRDNLFRATRNIAHNAFVGLYGGNIGAAAGVETIIECFRTLKEIENLYLAIAGEGSRLKACQLLAKEIGCPRIIFHTPWPKDETSVLLNAADVLILPTRHNQSLVSVPSKLISYMLAARPVIAMASAQSDLGKIIDRSGCGWVIQPDNPVLLAEKIREVLAMPSAERVRRGQAGRTYALNNLTSEVCLPKVINILEQAGSKH